MAIQIILSFIMAIFIRHTWDRRSRKLISVREGLAWTIFWILAGCVLWIPDSTTRIANLMGIGRGADLVFYFGLVILFFMVFRAYVRMEKIERDITQLVRKIAMDEFKKEEHTPSR